MKKIKIIKLVIILILIVFMIGSFIYSSNKFTNSKNEINKSLSVEGIPDESIVNGILKEKQRIEDEEYKKIWYPEYAVLSVGTVLIIGVLIIKINTKEGKE